MTDDSELPLAENEVDSQPVDDAPVVDDNPTDPQQPIETFSSSSSSASAPQRKPFRSGYRGRGRGRGHGGRGRGGYHPRRQRSRSPPNRRARARVNPNDDQDEDDGRDRRRDDEDKKEESLDDFSSFLEAAQRVVKGQRKPAPTPRASTRTVDFSTMAAPVPSSTPLPDVVQSMQSLIQDFTMAQNQARRQHERERRQRRREIAKENAILRDDEYRFTLQQAEARQTMQSTLLTNALQYTLGQAGQPST
jgi:hypothetical protein